MIISNKINDYFTHLEEASEYSSEEETHELAAFVTQKRDASPNYLDEGMDENKFTKLDKSQKEKVREIDELKASLFLDLLDTVNQKLKLSVVQVRVQDFSQNLYNFDPQEPLEGDPLMFGQKSNRKMH